MKKLLIIAAISLIGMNAGAANVTEIVHCPTSIFYQANNGQIGPRHGVFKFYEASVRPPSQNSNFSSAICIYTSSEYPTFSVQIVQLKLGAETLLSGNKWTSWPTLAFLCGYGIDPLECPFAR